MPLLKERKLAEAKPAAGEPGGAGGGAADGAGGRKSKRKLIIIGAAVVLLVAIGGGAFWFLTMRGPAPEPPPPEPGEVAAFEAISVNLAEGHYLKVGVALQLAVAAGGGGHGAKVVVDGSKAMDLTIEAFTGRTVAELSDPAQRDLIKEKLRHDVEVAYEENHHVVMDLYFTEFVTQ